jgi:hypothetical protein
MSLCSFNGTGGNLFIAFNNSTLLRAKFAATAGGAMEVHCENKQQNYELPECRESRRALASRKETKE